jgi:2,5-diketo-D-gluconate reductase A
MMQTIKLNNGVEMPILGLGVFQIPDEKECERVVSDALDIGYRLIDTASAYCNEQAVGHAIRKSGVSRSDLFVTTKLFMNNAGYEQAKNSFAASLEKLQLDYLDLYLIHQPYGDIYGAWRAMQELHREGRIRAIGLSNFAPDRVMDLIEYFDFTPAVNQVETHPFYQQIDTQSFLKQNNVQIEAWGPLAEGKNGIFTNEQLNIIGAKYNKSIAQVVLRWLIQRGIIIIPKSISRARMQENFDIFNFDLTADDMAVIGALDTNTSIWGDHRDPEKVKILYDYAKKMQV